MKAIRAIVAIAVLTVAGLAIIRVPIASQRCNVAKRFSETAIERASANASEFDRNRIAVAALGELQQCTTDTPGDWRVHFYTGQLNALAGRSDVALAAHERALRLQSRAEIYGAIGSLQLQEGEIAKAMANLERAAAYDLTVVDDFDFALRQRLFSIYYDRHDRLMKAKAASRRHGS